MVVVDETGRFAISLLSGHLGGANALAQQVARLCGATPVITTATDQNGVFAVDSWAKIQGCMVQTPENQAYFCPAAVRRDIRVCSPWPIEGMPPHGVQLAQNEAPDVLLTINRTEGDMLKIIPRIAVLGVGCKRNAGQAAIEKAFQAICAEANLDEAAVGLVCSIDRKADEPGLLEFCKAHGLPF